METARPTEPAPAVADETMPSRGSAVESDLASVANVSPNGREDTKRKASQTSSRQGKRLNLRVTRDWKRCPVVVCYRYHLVTERRKLPRHAVVDLAGLRLAPNLRSGVDKGDIDLLIEAVEHRRTINGRERPIFVATNLAGVAPHDSPF
jgi:hypothetical protein